MTQIAGKVQEKQDGRRTKGQHEYYRLNRDRLKMKSKENYRANVDRKKETSRRWYLANKERVKTKQRENRDVAKAQSGKSEEAKEKRSKRMKEYRIANRVCQKEYNRK